MKICQKNNSNWWFLPHFLYVVIFLCRMQWEWPTLSKKKSEMKTVQEVKDGICCGQQIIQRNFITAIVFVCDFAPVFCSYHIIEKNHTKHLVYCSLALFPALIESIGSHERLNVDLPIHIPIYTFNSIRIIACICFDRKKCPRS